MSKRNKNVGVQHHPDHGTAARYEETFDDDPLPSEQKIIALHAIDADILPWLKRTYEREQSNSHEYNMKVLEVRAAKDQSDNKDRRQRRGFRWVALVSATIILLGCCGWGGYLIYMGNKHGIAMLGVPVMLTIGSLIKAKMDSNKKKKEKGTNLAKES